MANQPPPEIAAHAAAVQAWLDNEAAADQARANPQPSAAERFDAIRTAQYSAGLEGRQLATPPAPVAVAVTRDLTLAERWGAWRDPRA